MSRNFAVVLWALCVVTTAAKDVPADVNFGMNGGEETLKVKPGSTIKVKIVDMTSTGYSWYYENSTFGVKFGAGNNEGVSGGGATEPPFLMYELSLPADFKKGTVTWEHVKAWERTNPDADKGWAVLHLSVAAADVSFDVPADVSFDMTGGDKTFKVKPGAMIKVKIVDMTSTGFHWFYSNSTFDAHFGRGDKDGVSGGGDTEPPFLMWWLTVPDDFKGGTVTWEHVKPWERKNPNAQRGYAVLHLSASLEDEKDADVSFDLTGGEKTLLVTPDVPFKVKIVDMTSTGYQWFLTSKPKTVSLGNGGDKGRKGGGKTEAPFLMWEMTIPSSANFKTGTVSWEHVRPWERKNPKADRGHAKLHLKVKSSTTVVV